MRLLTAFLLAALAVAASSTAPVSAQPDKNKLVRPDLKSKEWKKLKSGLEVWDAKVGTGATAAPGAGVKVHYTGWLTDEKGTIFDSSVKRGEPIEFPLNGVIKGWQEGIPGMKVGGVRRLRIPPDLAYGDRGAGALIGPGATLVFEVELLETK
jgi:FKBP-type peptidyl-prolyl cis-trans isomerase